MIGALDNDPLALQTYKANHKKVRIWEKDIRKVRPKKVLSECGIKPGQLDLLAGCPPCQGFSTLRTRNGSVEVDDPRNDLLLDFLRFIKKIRPRAVMMENVPGLAADPRFISFMKKMERRGYKGKCRILNASWYGVPQRRRRLIYLAGLDMEIPFAASLTAMKTVKETIGDLPKAGESGDPVHDIKETRTQKIMEFIRLVPKDGGSREDLPEEFQLECHRKCRGFHDIYGRMAWNDVAPTITSGCFNPSKGRFLHPEEDRAITMREAALLQGFPPKYRFPTIQNKSATALMIGNALPPPFIHLHASEIRNALQLKKAVK